MGGTILLMGGSRGIGLAAAMHLAPRAGRLITVSRTPSPCGDWVQADVATDRGLDHAVSAVREDPLDALLYLGGTWEAGAFTPDYSFPSSPRDETRHVIAVNLLAPILLVQALMPNLLLARAPRVILVGSLSGRDGSATVEVANTASKFGLRGAAQALALALPKVGFTLINPGNVATPEVERDVQQGRMSRQHPIPLRDLLAVIDLALGLSPLATVREIDLAQQAGENPP